MNGVIIIYDNESNCFPFVGLQKMFFSMEGSLEDRGNIFSRAVVSLHHPFFLQNLFCSLDLEDKFSEFSSQRREESIVKQDALNA